MAHEVERHEMAEWEKQIVAINLIVGDLDRSKTFYREVFGLPPQHEEEDVAVFRFKNMYVMLQHDPAHQAPPGEVLGLAQKGVGQFAIVVEDVDAVRAELDEHGVTLISGPADRDWGMRTLTFADPGGYIWEIAQDVS
jgi:catechol 2,3-dioxygenase-like lactoylglutathione lyase family enzyme